MQQEAGPEGAPPGQIQALFVIAGSQLLVLTLWFSAAAVAPQLETEWNLTSGETAGLTIAVQIGFVVGALGSAVFAVADVVPARMLFLMAGLTGATLNGVLALLGPEEVGLAFLLRLGTGVALAHPRTAKNFYLLGHCQGCTPAGITYETNTTG